jgi:hypothetical protein
MQPVLWSSDKTWVPLIKQWFLENLSVPAPPALELQDRRTVFIFLLFDNIR